MISHANAFADVFADIDLYDPVPMLDKEFDKVELAPPPADDGLAISAVTLSDDLAWDDQLDNGEEMSL